MATRTGIVEETREKTRLCPLWKVLIHNDDVTTMDFVVEVLVAYFRHDRARAIRLMMETHTTGVALAGIYPLETAEMKVEQVTSLARGRGFPLALTIERA